MNLLKDLIDFGIAKKYFEIKRIKDFPNSKKEGIDHIETKAIDFDTTTEKLCHEQMQHQFKSCDALDIVHTKDKINFIEFKQLDYKDDAEEWIQELELSRKIKESRDVLINIIRKKNFQYSGKMDNFYSCEKNIIISFSLTDDSRYNLAYLLMYAKTEEIIKKQFHNKSILGENFNEPICINMHKFDEKYPEYV